MSLCIVKNILNLENHELVKAKLEGMELAVEIQIETNESYEAFYNFLKKFDLQSVQNLFYKLISMDFKAKKILTNFWF